MIVRALVVGLVVGCCALWAIYMKTGEVQHFAAAIIGLVSGLLIAYLLGRTTR